MNIVTKTIATLAIAAFMQTGVGPAHADEDFVMCPDRKEGVLGGQTSCEFAENARAVFYGTGMPQDFIASSPVTGKAYQMHCEGEYPAHFIDGEVLKAIRCNSSEGAEIVIW